MKLSLIVLNAGKAAGQVVPVTVNPFVIGRDPECNLRPNSVVISKRHCAVSIRGGTVYARDFDSTNGTFVNDVPLKGELAVKDGDLLKVGPLEFRISIRLPKSAMAAKTPPPQPVLVVSDRPASAPEDDISRDEDIGDLLLELSSGSSNERGVPDGSTIMDLPIPSALHDTAQIDMKPREEKKKAVGTAQSAAQALFDRLNKRR